MEERVVWMESGAAVRRCGHQVPRPLLPNSHISIYPWGRRNVKDGGNHTHRFNPQEAEGTSGE